MLKRIYHVINNITKLKVGNIRKYQICSELEMEILIKYLCKKGVLFGICIETKLSKKIYAICDKNKFKLKFFKQNTKPELNKIISSANLNFKTLHH